MDKRDYADILVENDCYVNTSHTGESPIILPDGSSVPVYLSCRRLISRADARKRIENGLSELVRNNFPDAELVVGLATAGIAWAHAIASELDLPMAYVRSGSKGYGLGKLVEGDPNPDCNAIVVDDVLFSGSSLAAAMKALRTEKNIRTSGVASIITLNNGGVDEYHSKGVNAKALTSYEFLIDSAYDKNVLSEDERTVMQGFYEKSRVGDMTIE